MTGGVPMMGLRRPIWARVQDTGSENSENLSMAEALKLIDELQEESSRAGS
jgi:hypothetical protein